LTCHTNTVTHRKQQEAEWTDMTQIKGRDQHEHIGVYRNVILNVSYRTSASDVAQGRNTIGNRNLEYLHYQLALCGCHAVTGVLFVDVSKAPHTFDT
jgi:hypothetical protein